MLYPSCIGIAAALLLVSLSAWATEPAPSPLRGFWDYRSGIVHVGILTMPEPQKTPAIERWLGTGFTVDEMCTFATAKHVLAVPDRNRIAVRFQLPQDPAQVRTLLARVLYESPTTDLAFLKIDEISKKPCRSGRLHVFALRSAADVWSLTGRAVLIIGHPVITRDHIDIPVIRKGIISSTEIKWDSQRMLLLDLLGVPGFSGSPVILDDTGEAVGVIYSPGPTPRSAGFEWATPLTKEDYDRAARQGTFTPTTE